MRVDYKFRNLCGTVYKQGNLLFTPDGNAVVSPVGNRVSVYHLTTNQSYTMGFENRKDIKCMALNPQATLLVTVDVDGRALLVNFVKQTVLHHHNFKTQVLDIKFSPDGKYLAVTDENHVHVWKAPGFTLEFSPFELYKKFPGHYDLVTHIEWSPDSRYFVTSSKDMTCRIYSLEQDENDKAACLTGHKDTVLGCWFSKDMNTLFSVSKDGSLFQWSFDEIQEIEPSAKRRKTMGDKVYVPKIGSVARHYFLQQSKVCSASFHQQTGMLSVGFENGVFGIWELPDFVNIHTLSISQNKIDSVAINKTGEWLCFGSSKLGQLLVWEWQSESYVLKQQGHQHDMSCLAYSNDSQFIATGGGDGKVKLWNTQSGFCFVTFTEHTGPITSLEFTKKKQVVFSSSLDGTVRAFDLIRYRNFRTFTSPTPQQFTCLAVDQSGEIVVAATQDTFEIYMWSVQTGQLLDIIAGHEAPISCLAFSPLTGQLASGSWDKTVRFWDVYSRDKSAESLQHQSEILAMAFSPDGKNLCSTTMNGMINFWNLETAEMIAEIEAKRDITKGRKQSDLTASEHAADKYFNSICFTADGAGVICGGNFRYVCIYDVESRVLLKRFQITKNQSLDGMNELLNSKDMTEAGPRALIDETGELSDLEDRIDRSLPGVQKGDPSLRRTRPEARTTCVRFAPSGRQWASSTTEGLLIYTLDNTIHFDPFDLELDITPLTIKHTLNQKDYLKALVMSFRLGEKHLIEQVYHGIPVSDVSLVMSQLPSKYLDRMIRFLSGVIENNPRIQFHLHYCTSLFKYHAIHLKQHRLEFQSCLVHLRRAMNKTWQDISQV
ncbi:WD40-repeat-containing domain protein [Gorgonomyces haynaldii]|nr:WD40-repeat-containing domain protein [Gorgonomyces haynaldii]